MCAHPITYQIPLNDNRHRFICSKCQYIHYDNPKIIVGILPYYKNQILLCQRAIDPGYGLWTIPSGFMECDETVEDGARREAFEEVGIHCESLYLFVIYSLPKISQVYMLFLTELPSEDYSIGTETLDAQFYMFDKIPWNHIAFSVVRFSLEKFINHYPITKHKLFIR
tara:strand:- start:152 stop:655 length:504 start_codon:yes stop_codon:yes gene_type:complete